MHLIKNFTGSILALFLIIITGILKRLIAIIVILINPDLFTKFITKELHEIIQNLEIELERALNFQSLEQEYKEKLETQEIERYYEQKDLEKWLLEE